jgi:hypothetical protein
MTRNPYAQLDSAGYGGPGGPYGAGGIGPGPGRISALAVASLVFGIVCIIPGSGLLAVLLGVPALFIINASRGRLRGTGLAVTGVVLGLIASAIWVIVLTGAAWFNQQVGQQIFAPIAQTMEGIESGDRTKARAQLTPAIDAAVTDADLDAFRAAYHAEVGEFQQMPQSLLDMIRAFTQVGPVMRGYQQQPPGSRIFPAAAMFKNGWTLVLIEGEYQVGQGPGGQTMPRLVNIGVLTPTGREIWLRDRSLPPPPVPTTLPPASTPPQDGGQPPSAEPMEEPAAPDATPPDEPPPAG